MGWSFLTSLLNEINNHSTFVGKLWLNLLIVFRIVLTVVGGESIYYDEQSKFVCNTLQPGCENVCYNSFSPISHVRFWVFQIILVSTPSLMYLSYAIHKIARAEERAKSGERSRLSRKKPKQYYLGKKPHRGIEEAEDTQEEDLICYQMVDMVSDGEEAVKQCSGEEQVVVKARHDGHQHIKNDGLMPFYVLQLFACLLLEVAFLCGQYFLFGFAVSPTYSCTELPCPNLVDCFVSRPTEKTIFLRIMYAVSLLCLALNLWEILTLGICAICEMVRARKLRPPDDKNNIAIAPVEASTKDEDKPLPDVANATVTHQQNVVIVVQDSDYLGRNGMGDEPRKYRAVKWV